MSDLDLDAIEARANAATEGPWHVVTAWTDYVAYQVTDDGEAASMNCYGGSGAMNTGLGVIEDDAEFIAHARTDVPALVAEVRRLRNVIEEARDVVRSSSVPPGVSVAIHAGLLLAHVRHILEGGSDV